MRACSCVCLHVCLSETVHLNFPSITSYYPGDKSAALTEPPPILAAPGPNAHPSTNEPGFTEIMSFSPLMKPRKKKRGQRCPPLKDGVTKLLLVSTQGFSIDFFKASLKFAPCSCRTSLSGFGCTDNTSRIISFCFHHEIC